jgi:helicase HerA-like protein
MSAVAVRGSRGAFWRRRRRGPALPGGVLDAGGLTGTVDGERGFVLAKRVSGERALPTVGRAVLVSPGRLCRHVLVCGATGSGKTETVLRLAWTVAKCSGAPVFYLDGKGDRDTARRFCGLMADAGRETRVFPVEAFDGWRGEPHEIQGRLMEIIDYSTVGPASWYRDIAKTTLGLVCAHPEGPPRSSTEALLRMNLPGLRGAHPGSSAAKALSESQVNQVRLRYEAFFGQTRGALDGRWAWEDTQAAYLLLDSLALREETSGLARFLFEDFAHYFTARKARGQFCVLIVDEFSALASNAGMAGRVEQARGFNTGLVLAPQVVAGMGDEVEAARILGSVETVICHRVNTPEEIITLAGTRRVVEYSSHYGMEGATGEGSARVQHQYKVDPNHVRSLPPGVAFIISRGRAMKAQVEQAPALTAALPEPTSTQGGDGATGTSAARSPEGEVPPPGDPRTPGSPDGVPPSGPRSDKGVEDLPF